MALHIYSPSSNPANKIACPSCFLFLVFGQTFRQIIKIKPWKLLCLFTKSWLGKMCNLLYINIWTLEHLYVYSTCFISSLQLLVGFKKLSPIHHFIEACRCRKESLSMVMEGEILIKVVIGAKYWIRRRGWSQQL